MIKLKDEKKPDLESEIDEAKVEEAMAKWEAVRVPKTPQDDETAHIKGEK